MVIISVISYLTLNVKDTENSLNSTCRREGSFINVDSEYCDGKEGLDNNRIFIWDVHRYDNHIHQNGNSNNLGA